jgi:pimeloyl-ACP methyl ester carboxylesterase
MLIWMIRGQATSAADLKFLHHLPQTRLGASNRKSGTKTIKLLVPLCFPSSYKWVPLCITKFGSGAPVPAWRCALTIACLQGERPPRQRYDFHGCFGMNDVCLKFIEVGTGEAARRVAVRHLGGSPLGLFWLGGFRSDMKGTKAEALTNWASAHGRAMTRFDYSGHGESGGEFVEGTIGRWLEEAVAVFDTFCRGPQVVIGSSMGGWLALLLIREIAAGAAPSASIKGLVLIAPAVDFTEELMWKGFSPEIRKQIENSGLYARPSEYSAEPYLITRALIEEGRQHLLLGGMIETGCPVRILQGVQDPDVPWGHAVELTTRFARDDVVLTLVKNGDHRLSRPEDIERLLAAIAEFDARAEESR